MNNETLASDGSLFVLMKEEEYLRYSNKYEGNVDLLDADLNKGKNTKEGKEAFIYVEQTLHLITDAISTGIVNAVEQYTSLMDLDDKGPDAERIRAKKDECIEEFLENEKMILLLTEETGSLLEASEIGNDIVENFMNRLIDMHKKITSFIEYVNIKAPILHANDAIEIVITEASVLDNDVEEDNTVQQKPTNDLSR